MIDEVRSFGTGPLFQGFPDFRIGTTAKLGRRLGWRAAADFIFIQITYSLEELLRWRESFDFEGRVYVGVLVLASSKMAQRVNAALPDVRVPEHVIAELDRDSNVGIDLACEQMEIIRQSGAFDGVHLVPARRYREVAERLKAG